MKLTEHYVDVDPEAGIDVRDAIRLIDCKILNVEIAARQITLTFTDGAKLTVETDKEALKFSLE